MASKGPLQELCEEASCSVCLDFFRDPVSVAACGHNFCRDCLTRSWGESWAQQGPSCPQCRGRATPKSLRPNLQLANFVEIIKKLGPLEGKGGVCEKHREPLKFFCQEDGAPLCVVCSRSQEHRDHRVAPLEEAAGEKETVVAARKEEVCQKHQEPLKLFCKDDEASICVVCEQSHEHRYHEILPVEEASREYKYQFCSCVKILQKERDRILLYKATMLKESRDLLKEAKGEREKTVTMFKQLHTFLDKQEKLLLAQMGDVENEVARTRDQHLAEISEALSSLDSLIREMEEKCQQTASDLLQVARSTLQRYEAKEAFETPVPFPLALKRRIWDFSNLNPLLDGIEKQLNGNAETLHGPSLGPLAPAGNAQTLCGLPDASPRAGVTHIAPYLVPRPPGFAQAPRVVPSYKYASSVSSPPPVAQTLQASQPTVHMQGLEPLTASLLAAAPPQVQKQMLGEHLFPLIKAMHPSRAGKITGMLLELDNAELLHLLESSLSLCCRVEEAVAVLQAHQAKKEAARKWGTAAATSSTRKDWL